MFCSPFLVTGVLILLILLQTDLEKVVNCPKAENSEFYNVLKIAGFAIKDEENHAYQMLVWYDGILQSSLPILNP